MAMKSKVAGVVIASALVAAGVRALAPPKPLAGSMPSVCLRPNAPPVPCPRGSR